MAKKQAAADKAAAEALANKKSAPERIAEKKATAAAIKLMEDAERAALENETPAERRARMQEREIAADLGHAEDLFGAVGIGAGSGRGKAVAVVDPKDPTRAVDLAAMAIFKPTNKTQFDALRKMLVPILVVNAKKPHYNTFVQEFSRALAKDMTSENIRLVASKLAVLANEKQKEEKDVAAGKKKTAPKKVGLAKFGKGADSYDTRSYDRYDYDDLWVAPIPPC